MVIPCRSAPLCGKGAMRTKPIVEVMPLSSQHLSSDSLFSAMPGPKKTNETGRVTKGMKCSLFAYICEKTCPESKNPL